MKADEIEKEIERLRRKLGIVSKTVYATIEEQLAVLRAMDRKAEGWKQPAYFPTNRPNARFFCLKISLLTGGAILCSNH